MIVAKISVNFKEFQIVDDGSWNVSVSARYEEDITIVSTKMAPLSGTLFNCETNVLSVKYTIGVSINWEKTVLLLITLEVEVTVPKLIVTVVVLNSVSVLVVVVGMLAVEVNVLIVVNWYTLDTVNVILLVLVKTWSV